MPLGKGLESLIPKKDDPPTQAQTGEENFSSPKPAQASGHGVPLRRDERAEEQASPPRWGGRPARSAEGKFSSHQDAIFQIEVNKIKPNPHQPRRDFDKESLKELAQSIREFGVLQPLVVYKIEKETEFGAEVEYELIAGERRLLAVKMLGWERVPAIIRNVNRNSEQLEMAVVENLQRADLNSVETARAYAKLQDEFSLTQREIASRLGKSREAIANALRLLSLPTEIQEALAKNQINESQARLLLAVPDLNEQRNLFNDLLSRNLSTRELKTRTKKDKSEIKERELSARALNPEIKILEEQLAETLGARVKIDPPTSKDKSGKIIITFYSPEEIRGILQKIKPDQESPL